jgi:hypothetical protein
MLWLREVDPQDVIRQAATAQLLARLLQGQALVDIHLAIEPSSDLEWQNTPKHRSSRLEAP